MASLQAPSKAQTAMLAPFDGLPIERIHVPRTPADHALAVAEILAAAVVGFDTESKPTFHVGEVSSGPHVVQIALADRAFLFQLHREGALEATRDILQSTAVKKVGFGLKSDHGHLRRQLGIQAQTVLDLDAVFRKAGYRGQIGVRAAVGVVLRRSFVKSKSTTTSNWAAHDLSPRQKLYAANDAYAALRVWEELKGQK